MIAAFFATFFFVGTSEPVGPQVYGGTTKLACDLYATDLVSRIKRGQGKSYQPIHFKCETRGGGQ